MKILYSDILPIACDPKQQTIADCFAEQIKKSDHIEIAVGYISHASLLELDRLVDAYKIKKVCLNVGMYFVEGMPEKTYHAAIKINNKWNSDGKGEIRVINTFKYHGKVYCFYKNGSPFSAIIGSANLGVLKLEANNRRQYEISVITTTESEVNETAAHLDDLRASKCSVNIADISGMSINREMNASLVGVEHVSQIPQSNVDYYRQCKSDTYFKLPLKVPKENEKLIDDKKHFTKSNINVCYSAPRSKRKSRDWYETQITVSSQVYTMEGYPEKNKPFFVVTDDGFWFKAHTTSDNNKQFSAVGDELIMGRWLKGRLAAAGLVLPVNDTQLDTKRTGMITQEILNEYGSNCLAFKKTGQTALDEDGAVLDVWYLSFESTTD